MIKNSIKKIIKGENLTKEQAKETMDFIMKGQATPVQIAGFITSLRMKKETVDEITGFAEAMRNNAATIKPNIGYYIDTCGTGGDGANTFNISTATAFIVAASGVAVAKHGNRSVSSKCGCSDVLEELGINIGLSPQQVKECIESINIGFMFAPTFHKSMKYAAIPRRELGIRTVFNVLGPLTNPAMAKGQLMGVFDSNLTEPLANVLNNLGVERAMIVHGLDGLDEITTTADTKVSEVKDGKVISYKISPEQYGFRYAFKTDLVGGDAKENANIIKDIFKGEKSSRREIVVINAAAALYIGKKVDTVIDGIEIAEDLIDSGKAYEKLEEMIKYTNKFSRDN